VVVVVGLTAMVKARPPPVDISMVMLMLLIDPLLPPQRGTDKRRENPGPGGW